MERPGILKAFFAGVVGVWSARIKRLDPAFDALVASSATIEKVAGAFKFAEGPLWRPDGTLWFSDVQGSSLWSSAKRVSTRPRPGMAATPDSAYRCHYLRVSAAAR